MDHRDDENDPLYGFHRARRRLPRPKAATANSGDTTFALAALVILSFLLGFVLGMPK